MDSYSLTALAGAVAAIMLVSLIGKLAAWHGFGTFLERNTKFLATFAAGVFAVIAASLLQESLHVTAAPWIVAVSVVAGALFIEVALRAIPDAHHHHNLPDCAHTHSCIDARRMLASDALHNIGDGLILVPAFLIDVRVGLAAAIGVLVHEAVQELSEFFVLRQAGYSVRRALVLNFLVSGTILIGVGLALILVSVDYLEGPLLAMAAGGFLAMLGRDLVPHTLHAVRTSGRGWLHVAMFLAGATVMIAATRAVPHEHEHHEGMQQAEIVEVDR